MKLMNRLALTWHGLQGREKILMLAGTALVLLTALYLLFNAQWQTRAALLAEKAAVTEQIQWLRGQAELAANLSNNCLDDRILPMDNREALSFLAERNRIDLLEVESPRAADVRLDINAGNGNSILRFLHQSACQGFTLQGVTVTPSEEGQGYAGTVEVRREG